MRLVYDENKIKKAIKRWGYAPEHNYHHYKNQETKHKENVFISFKNEMGVLAQKSEKRIWRVYSSILAPKNKQLDLFLGFIDYIFTKKKAKKVIVEFREDFREKVLKRLKNSNYRGCKLNYVLYWPIFNMKKWDSRLKGKDWKKIRNLRNRLYRHHKVEIKHPNEVSKAELKNVVMEWVKQRNGSDRTLYQQYLNLIKNNFDGCDIANTIVIDGKPCSITAGWKIPNSSNYYSAIGILNYRYDGLGEFSNLYDLKIG